MYLLIFARARVVPGESSGRKTVSDTQFQDKQLTCADCQQAFVFTAREHEDL
jgi:hypothetical protein